MKNEIYKQLTLALDIAKKAHEKQKDKAGVDYIYHPITVALLCEKPEEKIVALLHDVVEDTDISFDFLEAKGFSKEVIDALKLVTHIKNEKVLDIHEEYRNYIKKLKASKNEIAINVKIADLTNNSDLTRTNGIKSLKYEDYI
mgnify:CR=1 FL=1